MGTNSRAASWLQGLCFMVPQASANLHNLRDCHDNNSSHNNHTNARKIVVENGTSNSDNERAAGQDS